MKKLALFALAVAFASCNKAETILSVQHNFELSNKSESSSFSLTATDPSNSDNPFDEIGRVHNQLFDTYFANTTHDKSVAGIATEVEMIASANHAFQNIHGAGTNRNTMANLQSLVGNEITAVSDAISKSSISQYAKASLQDFCSKVITLNSSVDDFAPLYTLIKNYEVQTLQDNELTPVEKEKILTVTSITRYSTYKGKKKPKKNTDSDWDMMIFGLAGSIGGAENSPAEAIVNALSAKILQNK
ncbi:hypothetical protein [Pedobacter sp. ASV28]|uniref:hypothetical protein n=1 Tax=Pedobacter sp. ASV28 TaxID=2795123 RepID=UPI0018EB5F86|nr:hypothetical protein [Pedobacter sp. ASV28]